MYQSTTKETESDTQSFDTDSFHAFLDKTPHPYLEKHKPSVRIIIQTFTSLFQMYMMFIQNIIVLVSTNCLETDLFRDACTTVMMRIHGYSHWFHQLTAQYIIPKDPHNIKLGPSDEVCIGIRQKMDELWNQTSQKYMEKFAEVDPIDQTSQTD